MLDSEVPVIGVTDQDIQQTVNLSDNSIYICGGYNGTNIRLNCYKYNQHTSVWQTIQSMSTERNYYGLVSYDSKLYAMGGYNIHGRLNSVEAYDMQTNTWKSVASMIIIREQFDATVMNNSIYACGGLNVNVSKFCEYYSPINDQWYEMVSMNTERRGLALVAHEGLLYAIGGYNDRDYYLNSVERYDTYSNKWTQIKPMLRKRYMFGSASFMGNIYVCGGEDINVTTYESCETYDPKTNQWTTIASMITGRRFFKLIVFNDILYALGGGTVTNFTETVEVYDYNSNIWYYTQSMPDKFYGYGSYGVIVWVNCLPEEWTPYPNVSN
ncbi:kelch-like protein 12 [Oppia nitens]|uniref:kelch-like protein 12 n=1 Tax=Oppia nitens TaxID=1686743 RepID=UPI0023DA30AE|nr:kelch-like protein 12 [Oppia nitens]